MMTNKTIPCTESRVARPLLCRPILQILTM